MQTTTAQRPSAKNVTVKLSELDRSRVQSLAIAKKRTPHYLMREAIEAYLQKEEAQLAMLKLVDEGNAHYEATGLHVTTAEMRTWLSAAATNPAAPRPQCHV
jgi:predicted transcriptional regulator